MSLRPPSSPSPLSGETVAVLERMIVAPAVGVFRPSERGTEDVRVGDVIGVLEGPGSSCDVLSPFAGTLMGMMAHAGERLREGQPVAWLRVAA